MCASSDTIFTVSYFSKGYELFVSLSPLEGSASHSLQDLIIIVKLSLLCVVNRNLYYMMYLIFKMLQTLADDPNFLPPF